MKLKELTKIILFNIFFIFLLTELFGRIYFASRFSQTLFNIINSSEISNYLKFVNHIRFFSIDPTEDISKNYKSFIPLNINSLSHRIYSKFSECKTEKCNTIFLQGDSWGEGIEQHSGKEIFSSFMNKGWSIYGLGTSSFSPSNFSAQLSYLSTKNITPDLIISFIDQTDLGDEFYRYKKQLIYPSNKNKTLKVKPFDRKNHRMYYNYKTSEVSDINPLKLTPVTPYFLLKIYDKLNYFVNKDSSINDDIGATPGLEKIIDPLVNEDQEVNNHFKRVLLYYLETVDNLGTKEIYLVTHPHYRHLIQDNNFKYRYNISTIIDETLENNRDKFITKIYHIKINPEISCSLDNLTCDGYFEENDKSSHPSLKNNTYPKVSKNIVNFIKSRNELGFID